MRIYPPVWLTSLPRRQKIALMVCADLIALPVCFSLALFLRAGNTELLHQYGFLPSLIISACTIPVFSYSGLYRMVVRYFDLRVLWVSGASLACLVALTYALSYLVTIGHLPRTGLLIYWFIAFSYVVISRFLARAVITRAQQRKQTGDRDVLRVAIFGAGEAGAQLATAMRASSGHRPVCFFDDDISLDKKIFSDLPVYFSDNMKDQINQLGINEVVLAVPSLSIKRRKQIVDKLHRYAVSVRTLPTLLELVDRKITMQSVRDIKIEDLLGRDIVPPREELFARCTHRKVVMVTGAGGSIGSELCRQIASRQPSKLILFDHSEFALYVIEQELRRTFPELQIVARIGSVCDVEAVAAAMRGQRIDSIYHAAAYKHVPMVEANMPEGIRNNVLGSATIANMADHFGVKTCVLISTDKAVRPTNIMGASKRIAELAFQAAASRPNTSTTFSMVRFGNVLGSSGSVVPLFRKQIRAGGPVTITHPDVIRFFMLIPEAAQLVIQAGAMAQGGEVFVLDMGKPVRITDLARTMIEMSGLVEKTRKNPAGDIEIKFVGLRPGEKLYEELLIGGEVTPSEHERIMCSHEPFLEESEYREKLGKLLAACESRDDLAIQLAVQNLVPEYAPYSSLDTPRDSTAVADESRQPTPLPVLNLKPAQAGISGISGGS
ncbi:MULTISPECIES: polysaccharide biosynthesis protein [Cupriavidus]|uniref:NAD-dependent epimerase/dehydratase:Short-chain dehydrogenase/reductase SDR:3-beta hydroxysteroid dehydrogenase/isomerase:Polysaccharide biosynthesis protein CapD:dTDP-4-dehydrorhamnose reductase n=1 Tax=Cupriavidus pinatubonensis (strain JMP 134 / LMG 1197) TaxID=264198 RepID=Q46Q63_CUPPJ|nr:MULTISPECIES: nucleoside-diphosphate sugar epimerase/dehydratase [Cupriavidus]